jgi:hypothetical protein
VFPSDWGLFNIEFELTCLIEAIVDMFRVVCNVSGRGVYITGSCVTIDIAVINARVTYSLYIGTPRPDSSL